jgi:hypothetical protein
VKHDIPERDVTSKINKENLIDFLVFIMGLGERSTTPRHANLIRIVNCYV